MKPVSLNQYVYAAASPLSNIDQDGLCANPSVCPPPPGSSRTARKRWIDTGNSYWDRYTATNYVSENIGGYGVVMSKIYVPTPPAPAQAPRVSVQ